MDERQKSRMTIRREEIEMEKEREREGKRNVRTAARRKRGIVLAEKARKLLT